jgi:hypothetical protein
LSNFPFRDCPDPKHFYFSTTDRGPFSLGTQLFPRNRQKVIELNVK